MLPGITPKIVRPPTKNASLLLHFNGDNASQIFVDDSLNNLVLDVAGDVHIDTSTSVFGGACATFDGTGDYLWSDDPVAFNLAGDFTIEGRIRITAENTSSRPIFDNRALTPATGMVMNVTTTETLDFYVNNGGGFTKKTSSGTLTAGTWYHWAICRASGVFRTFLNGTQFGTNFTDTTNFNACVLTIGAFIDKRDTTGPESKFKGNMDEFRYSPNLARYTTNFTPAGSPYSRYD